MRPGRELIAARDARRRRRARPGAGRPAIVLARIAVAAAGTGVGLRLAPPARGPVGPLDVAARLRLGRRGGTDVHVPPLGDAHLPTHRGPLALDVTARAIDPQRGAGLLDGAAAIDVLRAEASGQARTLAVHAAVRGAAAGVSGALALAALALRRPPAVAAAAGLSAAGLAGAAAVAAATVDRDAWRDVRPSGLLARAPQLLGDLQRAPGELGRYRDQLADLLRTASRVHARLSALPAPPPADAIRLVHVSDIHLSPFAFPLAAALVADYRADAVVDTGDLVDWGTPAESALLAGQIPQLGVPYVYIEGNHDSAATAAAVRRASNAVVLVAGELRTVAGLTLAGLPDPRFTPDKTTGDDDPRRTRPRVRAAARDFAATVQGQDVDVALVHAPAAAEPLAGLVPLVLAGDIHRRVVRVLDGTTVLVQGSTGGSGLRGVQVEPPAPVMLSVLFLDRRTRRLVCVDEVTLDGLGGTGVRIERRTVDQLLAAAA